MRQGSVAERIWSETTQNLLREADRVLSEWEKLDYGDLTHTRDIRAAVAEVRRARREFDAKLFFVVVFGPAKAGKSTLINTLARAYVSPTAFGKECTLRPSLIIQDRDTGIDEYFLLDVPPEEKDRQDYKEEAFQKVIDYLRGLIGGQALRECVRRESSPLSDPAIEEKLSGKLTVEPLITVIRVPGGQLIQDGIGILDMPGLDGSLANWRESPVHRWVIHRSDFLILMQSSIAALSGDTVRFLSEVVRESRNPPLWLVQNVVDAKHWRPTELRDEEAQRQEEETRRQVTKILEVTPGDLWSRAINLGKAEDGIFQKNEELLRASGFEAFERGLREIFDRERVKIQEGNSIKGMLYALEKTGRTFGECLLSLQRRRTEYDHRIETIRESIARVSKIAYDQQPHVGDLIEDVAALARSEQSSWMMRIEDEESDLAKRYDRGTTGSELNRSMAKLAEDMGELGGRAYLAVDGRFGTRIRARTQEELRRAEAEALAAINEGLAWLPLPAFSSPPKWPADRMPRVASGKLGAFRVAERRFLFFRRHYGGQEVAAQLNRLVDERLAVEVKERMQRWVESFIAEYLNKFCEDRRKALHQHLVSVREAYQSRMKAEMAAIQKTAELLGVLQSGIAALKPRAREALRAFE